MSSEHQDIHIIADVNSHLTDKASRSQTSCTSYRRIDFTTLLSTLTRDKTRQIYTYHELAGVIDPCAQEVQSDTQGPLPPQCDSSANVSLSDCSRVSSPLDVSLPRWASHHVFRHLQRIHVLARHAG